VQQLVDKQRRPGASASRLQAAIMAETLGLAAGGMLLGVAASLARAQTLRGLLFGVTAMLTYIAVPVVITYVALAAVICPPVGRRESISR
jgi:hypothetical protein